MKTDLINAKRIALRTGALTLVGGMLLAPALTWAAPTCAPTYHINAMTSVVTLTANCTPDPGNSISATDGYNWTPVAGTTSLITTTVAEADDNVYTVQARHPNASYGATASVTVHATSPSPCELAIQKADASLGTTETITQGASATLVPTCHGADSLSWYSSVAPSSTYSPIAPSGGTVTPAATTKYYVVGANDYGDTSSNEVTVTVTAPVAAVTTPLCALTASPLSIGMGGSTTLIATCPGATTFHWTGSGVASTTTESANVSAAPSGSGSFVYSVAGENASGRGTSVPVTVTVSAAPLSVCSTISPQTPSVTVGNASPQLAASCTNNPTSYIWKLNNSTVGNCTGSTCTIPANSLPSATTYTVTVTANNAGGTGTVDASATITVSQLALSSCSTISPSSPSVTTGNSSPQLSASCTNTPTSYVWKLDGSTVGNCTGSTCTIPANSLPTAGTYAVTVTANNAGGTGTNDATATITVADGATPPAGCGTTPAGTLIDTSNFTWATGSGKSVLEKISPDQTVAAKFHTPASSGATGDFSTVPPVSTVAPSAARYATISTCPGDFSVSRSRCYIDGNSSSANIQFVVGGSSTFRCVLEPDTDYYFNIGHMNPTSTNPRVFDSFTNTCTAGKPCGFFLQFGHN